VSNESFSLNKLTKPVVGQLRTDSKSNEITAIPELLRLFAIKGCIVTIDAMGCQTAIAGQIQGQGGDYLLALKSNHKRAYAAVKQHFHEHIEHQLAWRTADNFSDAFDDSHGYTVRRRVWAITDLTALPELVKWPGLQAVIVIETIRMAHQQRRSRVMTIASICPVWGGLPPSSSP
jgi:predicted transposase YbfD/YdcC